MLTMECTSCVNTGWCKETQEEVCRNYCDMESCPTEYGYSAKNENTDSFCDGFYCGDCWYHCIEKEGMI